MLNPVPWRSKAVMKRVLAVLAVLTAVPLAALAQKPVTHSATVETTATIVAIDHSTRFVALRNKDGETESFYATPEVKRFDELKPGDTVTFRYEESIVYKVRKPGKAASAPVSAEPKIVRGTGPRPGGTLSRSETATVTVKAVDLEAPSVTVLTEDGRTVGFKVADKKNLDGVKAGDKVEITYSEALIVSVK
jgi:Cu/Ag efflux protein CusF